MRQTAAAIGLLLGLCITAQAEVPAELLKAQAERVKVVAKARAATCCIFARGGRGGGSGVVISPDGFALSNFHVTNGAGMAMKVGMADGVLYDAVIVGIDPVGDVALIKLLGRDDFPYAPMADSDKVRQLDPCFASGNPFLLADDFQPTVTWGIVSGVHRYQYPAGTLLEYADCIQTDASINPGNSGGPLFNAQGEIIGINGRGSFEKRGRVNVGVGYAISINQIKNFLGYLKSGRIVDHATMGAQVYTDDQGRVRVHNILDSADAFRRGLRYGDEITHFGGRPIRTTNEFKNALGIFPRDWRVPLTYVRDGKSYETRVRLAGVHRQGELAKKMRARKKQPKIKPKPNPKPGPKEKPKPAPKIVLGGAVPKNVAKFYEKRDGYMNYYFNRVAQERIWKSLTKLGDYTKRQGKWTISGQAAGGLAATFELSAEELSAKLPGGAATVAFPQDDPQFDKKLDPPGSGGMFAALHLWRRFLVKGIQGFGDIQYWGAMPARGHLGLADCLIGRHGGVECRLLFDPNSGQLWTLEMYADDLADPCELHFSDYRDADGVQSPGGIQVRHGDKVYQVYKVSSASFGQTEEKKGP